MSAIVKARVWPRRRVWVVVLAVVLGALVVATGCRRAPPRDPTTPEASREVCHRGCVTPFGAVLGANGGVVARSNCSAGCIDPTPVHVSVGEQGAAASVYTGIRWQCVEYARRWWLTHRGIVFASVDTADAMWGSIRSARRVADDAAVPVVARENGGSHAPVVGDLVIYRAEAALPRLRYGHVAVVVRVDEAAGVVELAEQNYLNTAWADRGSYARRVRLIRRGESVRMVDDAAASGGPTATIYGWLHLFRAPRTNLWVTSGGSEVAQAFVALTVAVAVADSIRQRQRQR